MMTRTTLGATVGGCALVLVTALMSLAVPPSRGADPSAPARPGTPWMTHLTAADAALAAGDVRAAWVAWRAAHAAARASRRWDGLVAVADAYQRIARAAGAPGAPPARDLYLAALFRARDSGSREGVLRVAGAFETLGDREVAREARRMAAALR